MNPSVYLMPPLPVKAELFRQLLAGPYTMELFLGATGKPILALVLSAEHQDIREIRLVRQILKLIAHEHAERLAVVDLSPIQSARPTNSVFSLQADLLVDLDRYEVRRGNQRIALRAREAELLRILLRQPGCYVAVTVLAEAIGSEGSEEFEHPVEEMISNIRRKLGETLYRPRLLRCKRHAGYAIFPEKSEPLPLGAPPSERLG
ncbi:MAG TPA: winged helix-turn-helix domain-containing protein [Ktedonobacterales bacterium]